MWTLTLVGCAAWNVGLKPATGDTVFGISGERFWVGGVTARGGVAPGDWRSRGAVNVRPESSVVWVGPRDVEWVGPRDVEWAEPRDVEWVGPRDVEWAGPRDMEWVGLADCGTTVENYQISYEPTEQSASTRMSYMFVHTLQPSQQTLHTLIQTLLQTEHTHTGTDC